MVWQTAPELRFSLISFPEVFYVVSASRRRLLMTTRFPVALLRMVSLIVFWRTFAIGCIFFDLHRVASAEAPIAN
jgi:hypothetical protein